MAGGSLQPIRPRTPYLGRPWTRTTGPVVKSQPMIMSVAPGLVGPAAGMGVFQWTGSIINSGIGGGGGSGPVISLCCLCCTCMGLGCSCQCACCEANTPLFWVLNIPLGPWGLCALHRDCFPCGQVILHNTNLCNWGSDCLSPCNDGTYWVWALTCTGAVWSLSLSRSLDPQCDNLTPWFTYAPVPADTVDCTVGFKFTDCKFPFGPANHCGCPPHAAYLTPSQQKLPYIPPPCCIDTDCCKEGIPSRLHANFTDAGGCPCLQGAQVPLFYDASLAIWHGNAAIPVGTAPPCPGGAGFLHAAMRTSIFPQCFEVSFYCDNNAVGTNFLWNGYFLNSGTPPCWPTSLFFNLVPADQPGCCAVGSQVNILVTQ